MYTICSRRVRRLLAALFAGALAACALPALAAAACPVEAGSNPLAQLGDNASYFLLEGGSFESGAPGWSLSNAEVVNEGPAAVSADHSLAIGSGGVAVSPQFCVSSEIPSFRFFVRQRSGGMFGALNVGIRWTDSAGWVHETQAGSVHGHAAWVLGPVLQLASRLPLWMPDTTLNVRLVFRTSYASWSIADVYIDPYSRR
jgi:hypothetical protein